MTTPPPGLDRIVLASSNTGKLREFRELLAPLGIELVAQAELGIDDAEETGLTFIENALIKARHASRVSGLPALADDSGLCVDALDGAPGLYSARYAGPGADGAANITKLLDALRDVPIERRGAHFVCVLALLRHAEDPDPMIATGRWQGRIAEEPRGERGFGYDPVFVDPTLDRTAAEMAGTEKQVRSHRGIAFRLLATALTRQGSPTDTSHSSRTGSRPSQNREGIE